jgi:hypothetical protein
MTLFSRAALLSLGLLSASVADASNCTPVLKARNLPVYDQGETNTCYAFAATQAFDSWRQGHGAKVPPLSSAPEAAFRFTAMKGEQGWKDVQNGSPFRTLRLLVSEGSCPYVSAHDFSHDQLGSRWDQYERLAKARREYFYQKERIEEGKSSSGWLSSKTPRQRQQEVVSEVACDVVHPKLSADQLSNWTSFVEEAIDTRDTLTFMKTVFTAGCKEPGRLKAPGGPSAKFYELDANANVKSSAPVMRSHIDSVLAGGGGSIPTISYCPNVLSAPGAREVQWSRKQGQFTCFSGGSHASVVVGRRPGARGGCEYLVRNTWGTSCNQYAYPCQRGEIWVPANELFENTYGVSWLE